MVARRDGNRKFSPHSRTDEPRTERIDIRLTKSEKTILEAVARREHRTISSLIFEYIEILSRDEKEERPG